MSQNTGKMAAMIEQAERDLLHTYNRYQVVLDHGEGVYLYDTEGKKYLDFMAGIGVFALGYGNEYYNDALKAQIGKILHTSNYFYNEPAIQAAHRLKEVSGMDRIFFTNSGAEAVEGALKAAMRYAYNKDGAHDHQVVALDHSFHGRTYGALSVTGKTQYREPFGAMPCEARFAEMNDFDSVKAAVTDKTCAIIMETVQGEGGIYPADPMFIKEIRRICDEKDILLILDEIQCGMGRTGKMWAYEHYGIMPDIMTCAKALGCGVPVGAFVLNEKVGKNSLVPGDHGTTYGGNPFVCAAVDTVFRLFKENDIVSHAEAMGRYLEEALDSFAAAHPDKVKAHRGLGLIRGLEFLPECPVGPITNRALENGLLIISASNNVLRFVPPLVISEKDVDEAVDILEKCL